MNLDPLVITGIINILDTCSLYCFVFPPFNAFQLLIFSLCVIISCCITIEAYLVVKQHTFIFPGFVAQGSAHLTGSFAQALTSPQCSGLLWPPVSSEALREKDPPPSSHGSLATLSSWWGVGLMGRFLLVVSQKPPSFLDGPLHVTAHNTAACFFKARGEHVSEEAWRCHLM